MIGLILAPRLKKIADSINGFYSIADIGSDHAYLPIYLIKAKKIKNAIATDVNAGPVKIAQKRIADKKLESFIEVRKGNGLEAIASNEADVIVIAGMGGILISEIIENRLEVAKAAKLMVLQPMRDSDRVRRSLYNNGFMILDEELVKDDGKIYEIIWAVHSKENNRIECDDNLILGKAVIAKKHPLLKELIDKRVRELEKIMDSINGIASENCAERATDCKRLLEYYEEVRRWL